MSITEFRGPDTFPHDIDRPEQIGRIPPQDDHAEQSVLGAMMLSKDAIADVVEAVRGTDFYKPAHELIYDAVLDLYGRGEPADAVTVAAALTRDGDLARAGGAPYLHTLVAGVPVAANAGYYAAIVREKAILRRLVAAGTKIVQLGYTGEGVVDDVVDQAQAEVYSVTEKRTSEDFAPIADIMELTIDELEAISNRDGQMAGVPTGFVELDDLTNGLHGGQMVIVAARPAIGKSTIGLDMCRSASIKHALTSVIFSLEMSRTEITMRMLAAEARIPLHHMRNGRMSDDDWQRLVRTMGEVSDAPLFIDDSPNMTMMEIRAKARRLKQRHDLRLILIDYMQLMTSGKKVESRQVEVSEFSRQIKLLAKELDIPVVAISQLNRGSEQRTSKRPLLSDLRESGCVTTDTRLMRADTNAEITLGELLAGEVQDIPVWSLDDRLKLVPRTLTHAFPSGTKEVFRVRLASGREIKATANHPFLTYDGWTPLAELAPGSRVGVARHVPAPLDVTPMDGDELVLLGHLIGDGSFVRGQPIRYASIDEDNLAVVAESAKRRFGITAVRHEYAADRCTTLRLPAPHHLTHGKRNPIAAWLDGLGLFGLRSHERFVPAPVFAAPKQQVGLFLRHLWATDGSVRWDAVGHQAKICYASTSRRLVDDVALLLLRFDVQCRIYTVPQGKHHDGYQLRIHGGETQRRFLREIGFNGNRGRIAETLAPLLSDVHSRPDPDMVPEEVWNSVSLAMSRVELTESALAGASGQRSLGRRLAGPPARSRLAGPPARSRLAEVAGLLADAELEVQATNDVFWDRVVEIASDGTQCVYDGTVLGLHNFVANGMHLHNSLEQDADMVMLLHREDAYERESTRPGEADLIVAKHRNGPTKDIVLAFQGHYSRFVDMAQG